MSSFLLLSSHSTLRIDYVESVDGLIPTIHFVIAYNIHVHVSDQKLNSLKACNELGYKLTELSCPTVTFQFNEQ